jgi:multidrug efflux pump subunit AcrA (membrane-fusion protein)
MGLIEGMRIDIDIPTLKKEDALLVPRDAVIKRFEKDVVFAVVDAKAVMIPVKIIGYKIDRAAVSAEGLSEEMRVVVKGNERITPNMPIVEKVHQ